MNRSAPWSRARPLALLAIAMLVACSGGSAGDPAGGAGGTLVPGTGGAFVAPPGGTGGAVATGGSSSSGGAPVAGSGGSGTGGAPATSPGTGGAATSGRGGSGGPSGSAGRGATGGAGPVSPGTGGGTLPANCTLPATVSFQKDVQPFLITSCGGGNGCHVIDAASTVGSGGFNHAYDWLTGGAHPSSCPVNNPMRFQVVIAVVSAANPPSCSKSRFMPPPDATGTGKRTPLTACQVATLQAWLGEPLVTQMHRADDTSPTTPYPMPPFN